MLKKLSIISFAFAINIYAACAPTGALTLDLMRSLVYKMRYRIFWNI